MNGNINVLTWNVNNQKSGYFYSMLSKILVNNSIDIVVLQEAFSIDSKFFNDFEELTKPLLGKKWVRIFLNKNSGYDYSSLTSTINNKMNAVEIYDNNFSLVVVGVHLYSKVNRSKHLQDAYNEDFTTVLLELEKKYNHNRIALVGDFNYHPFDEYLNSINRFNAINSRKVINDLKSRRINLNSRLFYYNPMWCLLGDYHSTNGDSIPGTYYMETSDPSKFYWSLLDGVILNQKIMYSLNHDSLLIPSFLVRKIEAKKSPIRFSDHLPVYFSLNKSFLTK